MIERGDNFRQVKGDPAWHVMQMREVSRDMQFVFGGEDEARKSANRKRAVTTRENKKKRATRVKKKKTKSTRRRKR